jgi:hypothetical protein
MAGYSPLKITGSETGLVQQREEFLLPNDAYPILQNSYVWRERILRKKGYQLLGRLQRNLAGLAEPNPNGTATYSQDLLASIRTTQPNAQIQAGTMTFVLDFGGGNTTIYTENGAGVVTVVSGPFTISSGSINYTTGLLTLNFTSIPGVGITALTNLSYYSTLPVMGIRIRELPNSANDQTIFFDQIYAYIYNSSTSQFEEWIPGTTWNASNEPVSGVSFFWTTNYWSSGASTPFGTPGNKLFWVTNNSGALATPDPIRVTDGTTWVDFTPPTYGQIDANNYLVQCLALLPFRGRLLAFNTYEGKTLVGAINYYNRIRWSTIGNPFIPFSAGPPATGSWRDDIRGQGGFLDIPTSEDIISVGFVRDNLIIYCERSTWQLRYTGRSIAPFQIEKVNSELGAQSAFSTIQFDTSLVGIGDKGIVECDSYKSEKIDIKIPDLVWKFWNLNKSTFRIQSIRDFRNRLAFWTISISAEYDGEVDSTNRIFPNQRLLYNYENDSWALFNDSLTALGNFQPQTNRTWLNTTSTWLQSNFSWIDQPPETAQILGGNQQGFIEYLDKNTTNDVGLFISNITAGTPIVITSPNHNMKTDYVIGISRIPETTPFSSLNGGIYSIVVTDANNFELWIYNPVDDEFSIATSDNNVNPYIGSGVINIRENFSIQSKKFNFLDEGQSIQIGYIDVLMNSTGIDNPGAISINMYLDYNDIEASNTLPMNEINDGSPVNNPDTFFNSIIPTTPSSLNTIGGTKFWQRVYCATRANFLTIEYTFSNSQMAGIEQGSDVQIDAQVIWLRKGGRLTPY